MPRLIDRILTELKEKESADIPTTTTTFKAVLRRDIPHSWDVSMFESDQIAGYVVVQLREDDRYHLENQAVMGEYKHPGMKDGFGWGIEVHPRYHGRRIGHALLSIGIGLALRDFLEKPLANFEVFAGGLGDNGTFYEKFGFKIQPYNLGGKRPYLVGRYRQQTVPDIAIV